MRFVAEDDIELIYVDLGGRFRNAIGLGAVPHGSRKVVRVVPAVTGDMARPAGKMDDDRVHVVDLTRPDPDGSYTTSLLAPLDFEARALAALPPGAASRVEIERVLPSPAPITEHRRIVLYGNSWCGACKQARDYFAERGTAIEVRNLETDPSAVDELATAAGRVGITLDRVPVIDVRGRLLVGFEARRIDALLGDPL